MLLDVRQSFIRDGNELQPPDWENQQYILPVSRFGKSIITTNYSRLGLPSTTVWSLAKLQAAQTLCPDTRQFQTRMPELTIIPTGSQLLKRTPFHKYLKVSRSTRKSKVPISIQSTIFTAEFIFMATNNHRPFSFR